MNKDEAPHATISWAINELESNQTDPAIVFFILEKNEELKEGLLLLKPEIVESLKNNTLKVVLTRFLVSKYQPEAKENEHISPTPRELTDAHKNASSLGEAIESTKTSVGQKTEKTRRDFIEKLLNQYIQKSKERVSKDQLSLDETRKALETAMKMRHEREIRGALELLNFKHLQSKQIHQEELKQIRQILRLNNESSVIYEKIYEKRYEDPSLYVSLIKQRLESNDQYSIAQTEEEADRASRGLLGYASTPSSQTDLTSHFFQNMAKPGLGKAMAPILDAAFSIFPRETREKIINGEFRRSMENLAKSVPEGGNFILNRAIRAGNNGASTSARRGGINLFEDLFSTIVRGPIDRATQTYLKNIRTLGDGKNITTTNPFVQYLLSSDQTVEYTIGWQAIVIGEIIQQNPTIGMVAPSHATGGGWFFAFASHVFMHEAGKKLGESAVVEGAKIAGIAVAGWTPPGWITWLAATAAQWGLKIFSSISKSILGSDTDNGVVPGIIIILLVSIGLPLMMTIGIINTRAPITVGLQKGGEDASGETGSQYIRLSKKADPDSIPDNIPKPITYTIVIGATTNKLTNIRLSDSFMVYGGIGTISPPLLSSIESISPGEEKTLSFTVPLSSSFKDSVITNTLTVTADTGEKTGETKTAYASVIIGEPDVGCFQFKDSGGASNSCKSGTATSAWLPQEKASMIFAASQIAKHPLYLSKLKCASSPIPLYRVKTDFGGGCFQDGGVYIYNGGVIQGSSVYTLAHETGHVLQYRNGSYYQLFLSKGISSPGRKEGFLPTYPGDKTDAEDFAETIGLFIGYPHYYPLKWNSYPKYPGSYPLHEKFAQCLIINDSICSSL